MEEHQELEKPISESRYMKFRRSSRVFRDRRTKTRVVVESSKNHNEELSCYLGLSENSQKTQKRNKKSLVPCEDCGKGFRYEKCLLNHRQVMHSNEEEYVCSLGFVVQRRKRSKRVFRYNKIHLFSVSSSSFDDDEDGELLEVAESLILLSKSGGDSLNAVEFGDGFVSNAHKLVGSSTECDGTWKELLDFLGDKKATKEDVSAGAALHRAEDGGDRRGVMMLQNAEKQKLGPQETALGDANSGTEIKMEYRCGLCDKAFFTHQALGGHQTFHRKKVKKTNR